MLKPFAIITIILSIFVSPAHAAINNKDPISMASSFLGKTASDLGLPSTLWCADFMNMLFGGSDRTAFSYINRGIKANHGCVNCVAVTKRKGGGHVGIVKGYDKNGNPILISGNHKRRVGVGTYNKNIVVAYRFVDAR